MSWIYLVLAGLCEIGWPLGFKLSQTPGTGPGKFAACIACSVFSMVLSGFLLWLAQRNIPIGTAYAVWTGIGALGTFLVRYSVVRGFFQYLAHAGGILPADRHYRAEVSPRALMWSLESLPGSGKSRLRSFPDRRSQ